MKKKEWRHSFFSWKGYINKGTLFDYSAIYNRHGLIANGDLSIDDIAEVKNIKREVAIENAEKDTAQEAFYAAEAVYALLNQNDVKNIPYAAAQISSASQSVNQSIDDYWNLMSTWIAE